MSATLFTGIGELVTNDPTLGDGSSLGLLHDAALVAEDARVAWVGPAASAPAADARVDLDGAAVIPGFVDSHTHLVFAGERSDEFAARMDGRPYSSGGIATTVAATRAATRDELHEHTARLVHEMNASGTTTVEIKSGYGLTVPDEVRLLEVAGEFTDETTFLGAHVVPTEYERDRASYVDLVCGDMLAACVPYARWIDVFCDTGAFTAEEARRMLAAGVAAGLGVRIHGNQLGHGPGAQLAAEFGAASVDHATFLTSGDIDALRNANVVATLLPAAEFCTRSAYADARALIDAGVTVALATDCNPGSAYVTAMPFCIAVAVREQHMTPAEAVRAATWGGAQALRRDDVGRLSPGTHADFAVLDAQSYVHLAYRPGSRVVSQTWQGGVRIA